MWFQETSLFFRASGSCTMLATASSADVLRMLSTGLGVPWGNHTPCLVEWTQALVGSKQIEEENLHSDKEKQGLLGRNEASVADLRLGPMRDPASKIKVDSF